MSDTIEPLDQALWFERIEKIATGGLDGPENALRHAAHLLQLTPAPFRDELRLGADEAEFEALLAAGAFDAAARHLAAQPVTLSLETNRGHRTYRATIGCSSLGRAISGTGETEALAILDAWTRCLLGLRPQAKRRAVNWSLPGPAPSLS